MSECVKGATETDDHSHSQFTIIIYLTLRLWMVGGNQSTWRKPTQAQGENAGSTQEGPSQLASSSPEPSCYKACNNDKNKNFMPTHHISWFSLVDGVCSVLIEMTLLSSHSNLKGVISCTLERLEYNDCHMFVSMRHSSCDEVKTKLKKRVAGGTF